MHTQTHTPCVFLPSLCERVTTCSLALSLSLCLFLHDLYLSRCFLSFGTHTQTVASKALPFEMHTTHLVFATQTQSLAVIKNSPWPVCIYSVAFVSIKHIRKCACKSSSSSKKKQKQNKAMRKKYAHFTFKHIFLLS